MAKRMNKLKLSILAALILLITAGGVAAWLSWGQPPKQVADTPGEVSIEETPQYGACQLITSTVIKDAPEASRITSLEEGKRIGHTAMNGTVAESCEYTFTTQVSAENSLTTSISPYTPATEGEDNEVYGAQWAEVFDAKSVAYFASGEEKDGKITVYHYRLVPGSQNVLFSLRQPADATTYDKAEALRFLMYVADNSNSKIVQNNAQSQEAVEANYGQITDGS